MRSCFFFHNPKAGGTALFSALAELYDPPDVAPWVDQLPEVYGRAVVRSLPSGFRLYAGHYGYDQYCSVMDGHMAVTNFRHPSTRLLSLYNYFRSVVPYDTALESRPEYHAVRLARGASFEAFVASEDPRVLTYTSDHHFRQLANSGWRLQADRTLEEVCDLIDEMPWFYVCEYPMLSIRWARAALGAPHFKVGLANVSPGNAASTAGALGISEEAFSRILDINMYDLAIYGHALERFFSETARLINLPTRRERVRPRRNAQFAGLRLVVP